MTYLLRFCAVALVFTSLTVYGQRGDSILSVLDTAKNEHRVKALNELFRHHFAGDPVKAVGYAREALSYASEVGDQKGLAAAYNNLGVAYRTQGAMDRALEYYINALKIYEALENKEGVSATKNNIANIYSIKKDYEQSMKYMTESYNMFVELNDTEKIIGSLNNLGNLHSEMQMDEKALEYYQEAYKINAEKGTFYGDPLTNIGNLYFKKQEYDEALRYYQEALDIERKANNRNGILNALTNLGVTSVKMKKSREAEMLLNEALALCTDIQAFSFLPALYKAQAENFSNMGNWRAAYETQVRYDEARELVFGEESTRKIAQMELRLSFQDMEKQFELLKQEDEIKTLELRNARLIILIAVLGVMCVLGVLNYVFLSRRKPVRRRPAKA